MPHDPAHEWRIGPTGVWDLARPRFLAILNLTPDSFSDGGKHVGCAAAVEWVERCLKQGADGVDVGGESTRPGAARVPAEEQLRRVVPVIKEVRAELGDGFPITIDTTLAAVATAALDAGASGINDVAAGLEDEGMFPLAAARGCGIVLMHRLRPPASDRYSHQYAEQPRYPRGVVAEVREFLRARAEAVLAAGVGRSQIMLDPGLGFGKSVEQNLELIEQTGQLVELGYPVLSGVSRKSFVARWAGLDVALPPEQRAEATVRLSLEHYRRGARVFRVHDVEAHVRAFREAGLV